MTSSSPDDLKAFLAAAEPLPDAFYRRSAERVARELLGKALVTRHGGKLLAGEIVEVEAYLGNKDPASHAFRGETKRTRSMFLAGGACYVYLSYGVNWCMNVVTGEAGHAEAVLLRAVQPLLNETVMAENRGLDLGGGLKVLRRLTNGPGKLTEALGIGPERDGQRFDRRDMKLVDLGAKVPASRIGVSPRIGITKAAEMPLRFFLKDSPFLSR